MGAPNEEGSNVASSLEDAVRSFTTENHIDRTLNLVEDDTPTSPTYQHQSQNNSDGDFRVLALNLVHKLSNEIHESNVTATLMQEVVEIITKSFPITFASIEKFDSDRNVSFSALSIDPSVELLTDPRSFLNLEDTLCGEVLRRNATLILSNQNKDELNLCPSLNQAIKIKHYIGIPIIVNAKTIGVFAIASIRNITVDKETITWAETIGHHLSAIFTREEIMNTVERTEHMAHYMLEAINAPTIMCDWNGNILHSNFSFNNIVKQFFSSQYRISQTDNILKRFIDSGADSSNEQKFSEMFSAITQRTKIQAEFDILLSKGSNRKWFLVNMSKVSRQDSVIIMFVDVTKRKQVEEKLEHEILHDPTSGLANRMFFHEKLNAALDISMENKKPVCVFSMDVGRYGFIVESLGHDAADEVMREAARRIQSITRIDDLIARIGSSEFAILLNHINNANDAQKFAKELISVFSTTFIVDDQEIMLRPSIGITITNIDKYLDADIVLHDAHSAMTVSRDTSTDQFAFASLRGSAFAIKKLNKERELSKAILKSQLAPFYQPEFDITTNELIGAESLARWYHPRHGILTPKHFIDIAEETNLIGPLFESIFKQVLIDTLALYENGHKLTIWTNISANQFQTHNISQIISELAKSSNAPIEMIGIEITETALMKDLTLAAKEFAAMKKLGIQIALDDFGTGYSSLSHLAQFPVDMLKIDQSFVDDIPHNHSAVEIVSAVIGLAHGMRIKTLAEGIENESQLKFLNELGCDFGQGYYFDKPHDFDYFLEFTKNYK